ncbi:MAG: hypothetical protein R3F16_02925 [Myxococcota bacterium]
MLQSLARLFVLGVDVAFDALNGAGRVVRTPLYAYQRERYWFATRTRQDRFRPTHPLLGRSSQSSVDPRLHVWDFARRGPSRASSAMPGSMASRPCP